MEITRSLAKEIQTHVREAMETLVEEFSLEVSQVRASYGPTNMSMRIQLSVVGEDGQVMTSEAEAFKRNAGWLGFSPDDLGRWITGPHGEKRKITGYNTRARKYPIQVEDRSGRKMKASTETVLRWMKLAGTNKEA